MIRLFRRVQGHPNFCPYHFNIYVSWNHPKTWFDDYLQTNVHLAPGGVQNRGIIYWYNTTRFDFFAPVRIVEWPSADAAGTETSQGPSLRQVDASDLSSFSACYSTGPAVRWGFDTETPPNSPNFQCNLAPFGGSANSLDASDLSAFAADLGKTCQVSKLEGANEFAAILEWFGIAATGRMAAGGPNGETVPEYDIVDRAKNQRAIADPYGYRNATASAATRIPWGRAKSLYR